jgi:ribonuclease P protein component
MLKKENRADRKTVEKIFKQGHFLNTPHLTFKFVLTNSARRKISFVAPKSVAKLAVKRNLLRRHGYDALSKYLDHFPVGIEGVFVFKKCQEDIPTIENEIKNILSKIN